jgi:putative endonuclease
MYYLYILQSLKDNGFYIGITSNIEKRLKEHNNSKTKSTKSRIPFNLIYSEQFKSRLEARAREVELKTNYSKRKELYTKLGIKIK